LRGVARALVAAVAERAKADRFHELGSDVVITNRESFLAHRRLAFEPTERVQFFRKNLRHAEAQAPLQIEAFRGLRSELRPLFAQADDSPTEINSYIESGNVLVAHRGEQIVGHVQLLPSAANWEIKSIAVIEKEQGQGIGSSLVRAALERAFSAGTARVVVATATADIGNLRFYQRLGFRMERIERDAFNATRGYPALEVDGIPVRDRVWFSMDTGEYR
jgi:ribosomal protein S18 acetylase RimI-like enzyme